MKRVDWSFIKPLWVAGGLSNLEIVKLYDEAHKDQDQWKPTVTEAAIRKHAKKPGNNKSPWQKEIANKVKSAVREKVVRKQFETRTNEDDDEVIASAADSIAEVLIGHRQDIQKLKALVEGLEKRYADEEAQIRLFHYQGFVIEHEYLLGLGDSGQLLERITKIRAQIIQLERQAFGVDDDNNKDVGQVELIQNF